MSHIKQGGNKPVHMLAKYAIRIGSFVTWVKENPVIFKSVLAQDVLNLFHLNKVTCLFINQKKKIYIYIYRRSFGQYHIDAYLEQYSIYSCKFSWVSAKHVVINLVYHQLILLLTLSLKICGALSVNLKIRMEVYVFFLIFL